MLQSIIKILFYKLLAWSLKDMNVYRAEKTRFSCNLGNVNGFIVYYRLKVRISKLLLLTFCQLFMSLTRYPICEYIRSLEHPFLRKYTVESRPWVSFASGLNNPFQNEYRWHCELKVLKIILEPSGAVTFPPNRWSGPIFKFSFTLDIVLAWLINQQR